MMQRIKKARFLKTFLRNVLLFTPFFILSKIVFFDEESGKSLFERLVLGMLNGVVIAIIATLGDLTFNRKKVELDEPYSPEEEYEQVKSMGMKDYLILFLVALLVFLIPMTILGALAYLVLFFIGEPVKEPGTLALKTFIMSVIVGIAFTIYELLMNMYKLNRYRRTSKN